MKSYKVAPPLMGKSSIPWTKDEIQIALDYIKIKKTTDELAKKLNRTPGDVRSKMKSLAADMYLKDISYDRIHEITGVKKDTLILTPSSVRMNEFSDDEHVVVDISIYEFPETSEEVSKNDEIDEFDVIVSIESPFSLRSICQHISTPILSTCSILAKAIS
jgi:DNA-binding Lrp family transcriptional regulator